MKKEIAFSAFGFGLLLLAIFAFAFYFDKKLDKIEAEITSTKSKAIANNGFKINPTANRIPIGFVQKKKIDTTPKCDALYTAIESEIVE